MGIETKTEINGYNPRVWSFPESMEAATIEDAKDICVSVPGIPEVGTQLDLIHEAQRLNRLAKLAHYAACQSPLRFNQATT